MAATFSENWYRIAHLHAALRPDIRCRKQFYRGVPCYLLHDPHNKNFFRLNPVYYPLLSRLSLERSIEAAWLETLREAPETGPGQQDVISLLIELHNENLIQFAEVADAQHLFRRWGEKSRKETTQRWLNILFLRLPLWNPDRWLTAGLPLWKLIFSPAGALIWAAVLIFGVLAAVDNASALASQARNVLAPGNLPLLYAGIVLLKIFHELGHAALCKRFGGEVNAVGVMFLLFIPLPYVDATSAWELPGKWERMLVSAGGMLVEFFLGALACLLWSHSPPGPVHSLAYNMMFTASVSTLLFNINPLMRFDGYYLFTDLVEIPNLFRKSREQVLRAGERYLFGRRDVELPAQSVREGFWLLTYGLASMAYRVLLLTGILLYVADRYAALGLALALGFGIFWLFGPPARFLRYLFFAPALAQGRSRALAVTFFCGLLPFALALGCPLPSHRLFPGVVQSVGQQEVLAETAGRLVRLQQRPGSAVRRGEPLLEMVNPLLDSALARAKAQRAQIEVLEQQALLGGGGDRLPLAKRKAAVDRLLDDLARRKQALTLRAQQDGLWVFPDARELLGQWINEGYSFGKIFPPRFRFRSVVSQEEAFDLFEQPLSDPVVRLAGQGHRSLAVTGYQILPHAQESLPSQALGWMAGGSVTTDVDDRGMLRSSEPFYLLDAELGTGPSAAMQGRTGYLRVSLPAQSMGLRGFRYLRQFLQKRYQL